MNAGNIPKLFIILFDIVTKHIVTLKLSKHYCNFVYIVNLHFVMF